MYYIILFLCYYYHDTSTIVNIAALIQLAHDLESGSFDSSHEVIEYKELGIEKLDVESRTAHKL